MRVVMVEDIVTTACRPANASRRSRRRAGTVCLRRLHPIARGGKADVGVPWSPWPAWMCRHTRRRLAPELAALPTEDPGSGG